MRDKKGIFFMIIGALLILSSLSLLVYNNFEDYQAGKNADSTMVLMKQKIIESKGVISTDSMPVVEIDGYEYIGYLNIPTLNVELPVMYEWDYDKLKKAPCRQTGSILTDDLVIAGHSYKRHFGSLAKLVPGDQIIFKNMNGEEYIYHVTLCETLKANQSEEMLHSKWDLTLYTCTYGGKNRITIRANREL